MLKIRPATPADASTIADFNHAMAVETEHLQLDRERLLQGVQAVIHDPAKGSYLVAESDDRNVIGQLLVTFEWSDWRNGVFWWVQSVYVHPDHRGQGVYKALYQETLARAQSAGNVCGIRLYVERDNRRAKQTYLSQGMYATDYEMWETDFVLTR